MSEKILAIILMGSASDLPHVEKITAVLDQLGIPYERRISSAHKTPNKLLEILNKYEQDPRAKVYITVAGRSNALSGMADGIVSSPVIACPPYSASFGGADIYSSLRMPSGIAPMVVLEPANAALAVAKILAMVEPELAEKVKKMQTDFADKVNSADEELNA